MKSVEKTEQLVTVVRKRVVYDEVVMTFDEFNEAMKEISDFGKYGYSKKCASWNDLNFELDTCSDLCSGTESFAAFEGDIYSMTDDVIAHGAFEWFGVCDLDVDIQEAKFID